MQDLIMQERFELEVLDRLNSGKFLMQIVFGDHTRNASLFVNQPFFFKLSQSFQGCILMDIQIRCYLLAP